MVTSCNHVDGLWDKSREQYLVENDRLYKPERHGIVLNTKKFQFAHRQKFIRDFSKPSKVVRHLILVWTGKPVIILQPINGHRGARMQSYFGRRRQVIFKI